MGASIDLPFAGLSGVSFGWETGDKEANLEEVWCSRRQQRFSPSPAQASDAACLTVLTGQQEQCEPKRKGPS